MSTDNLCFEGRHGPSVASLCGQARPAHILEDTKSDSAAFMSSAVIVSLASPFELDGVLERQAEVQAVST